VADADRHRELVALGEAERGAGRPKQARGRLGDLAQRPFGIARSMSDAASRCSRASSSSALSAAIRASSSAREGDGGSASRTAAADLRLMRAHPDGRRAGSFSGMSAGFR
jgi:hypothetical protein